MKRKSSQIDPVQPTLAGDVWVWNGRMFVLREYIYKQVFDIVNKMFLNFNGGFNLVRRICIVGSITTKQYHEFSDLDINIEVDKRTYIAQNPQAVRYRKGIYASMMDKIVKYLEGMPVEGTKRTFSIHVYWYPFILSSDNIYCLYPYEGWIKGLNFPAYYFDPDRTFLPIKMEVEEIKKKLLVLISQKNEISNAFLYALEKFLTDWRQYRFISAEQGRGHFLSHRFSADWDSGNIAIKFLGDLATPTKFLFKD